MFSREKRLLKRLQSGDAAFRSALARDGNTPAAVLAALATDSSVNVRLAAASNPTTSEAALYVLGHDVERSVRAGALAKLLDAHGFKSAQRAMASGTSPQLLAVIAEDLSSSAVYELATRDPSDVGAHWSHRSEPRAEVLAELAKLRNPDARAAVAGSRFATPAILTRLAGDSEEKVRREVAGNESTPTIVLEALSGDSSRDVRDVALYRWVPQGSVGLRHQYASRPDTSYGLLRRLADDPVPDVRRVALRSLAENPDTPGSYLRDAASDGDLEALLAMAGNREPIVRMAAAGSRRLPLDALVALADDADSAVREHVARVIEHGYDYPLPETADEFYSRFPHLVERLRRGELPKYRYSSDIDRRADTCLVPPDALARLAGSSHVEIRRAVGQHPQVPAEVLARLLDDKSVFSWSPQDLSSLGVDILHPFGALHGRTWERHDEWRTIASVSNPETRRIVGFYPGTPGDIIVMLAGDIDTSVRESVLQNPGVPASVVRRLMDDPAEAVAARAFDAFKKWNWRFQDDLGLFVDAPRFEARATVAGDEHARNEWLEKLASDPDAAVRAAVAGNLNTPIRSLALLASDSESQVVDAIVRSVGSNRLPVEALEVLAESPVSKIRAAVAANIQLPDNPFKSLVCDRDESVRLAAASSGFHIGTAFVRGIMGDQWRKEHGIGQESVPRLVALARDYTLGPETLHSLAQSPFDEVRASVAANPAVSAATLVNLSRDGEPSVRAEIARSTNAPVEALAFLARDEAPEVRRGVAANPNTTSDVLASLDRDPDEGGRTVDAFFPRNPQFRDNLKRHVWQPGVRQIVALNPSTSIATLEKLARDPDTAAFVAANPSTPGDILTRLVSSVDDLVREAVAENPNTHEADLGALALDQQESVRIKVASNRHTARGALELLVKDFSTQVKEAARATLSGTNHS